MKKCLTAALMSLFLIDMAAPPSADACGVKLTVKGAAHRKGVSRTSNPSDVLLVGSPPRRLQRDLSAAGHRVEVAPTMAAAKRKSYKIIITDQQQSAEARSRFAGAVVMVRSGDVVADMRTVESNVARQPIASDKTRVAVAARETRAPVAAGPVQPRREIVTAAEPREGLPAAAAPERVATAPTPTRTAVAETRTTAATPSTVPTRTATVEKPRTAIEAKPAGEPEVVKPVPVAKQVVAKPAAAAKREVYFDLGAANAETSVLDDVVKWMNASPDVSIIVEGHADPSGAAAANMALSQQRAEFVRDALVTAGIDTSRIEVAPFGSSRLKYGRKDRRNRRAAIVVK